MQFCSTAIDNTRAKSHLNLKKYLKQIYPLRIHPFRIQREYLTKTRWSRGLTFLCNVKSRGEAAKACGMCQNATRDPSPVSSGLAILRDIGIVRSQVPIMEKRKGFCLDHESEHFPRNHKATLHLHLIHPICFPLPFIDTRDSGKINVFCSFNIVMFC